MKHSIQILLKAAASLLVAIVAATASGCHYHNINGDLDGQWQLMSITEPDGTEKAVGNTYYAIQMHTVNHNGSLGGPLVLLFLIFQNRLAAIPDNSSEELPPCHPFSHLFQ